MEERETFTSQNQTITVREWTLNQVVHKNVETK